MVLFRLILVSQNKCLPNSMPSTVSGFSIGFQQEENVKGYLIHKGLGLYHSISFSFKQDPRMITINKKNNIVYLLINEVD